MIRPEADNTVFLHSQPLLTSAKRHALLSLGKHTRGLFLRYQEILKKTFYYAGINVYPADCLVDLADIKCQFIL
ncbi:hypothetical protein Lspi_1320 [Legionella spiritensis]|uniref:Uncharacterized protein n=1 Tax=Legionella spiritensis TaxID=452 RepID=A0A0W0Z5X9_LEGSP|nr:hypothetical protein Lspi_1320 [Legionella spiritensis]SNV33141.1 Uncharacterised protein [Legionella spiritensis]